MALGWCNTRRLEMRDDAPSQAPGFADVRLPISPSLPSGRAINTYGKTKMDPMKPMKPLEPMKPKVRQMPWWPDNLGEPSSSGGQNEVRYAFFPDKHRLLVEQEGTLTSYDSADYQITGVSQQQSERKTLTFSTRDER